MAARVGALHNCLLEQTTTTATAATTKKELVIVFLGAVTASNYASPAQDEHNTKH